MATNKLGKAQHTIQFKEARNPGPIRQVFMKTLTATSVTFEIAGPADDGGIPVHSYEIQYKPASQNTWEDPKSKTWPAGKSMNNIIPAVSL